MFIVLNGIAEVISDDESVVYAELENNNFFGEVALFFDVPRTATVRAKNCLTLFELTKDALQMVMTEYSSVAAILTEKAALNYDLVESRQKHVKDIKTLLSGEDGAYSVEVTGKRLQKIPLFKNCGNAALNTIAMCTSISAFKEGDRIITKGEITDDQSAMYIIVHGIVEIVGDVHGTDSTVYASMSSGTFFGEVGLLNGITRTASIVVASDTCETIKLTAKSLEEIKVHHRESYDQISLEAARRLDLAQMRELDAKERHRLETASVTSRYSSVSSIGSTRFTSKLKNIFRMKRAKEEDMSLPLLPVKITETLQQKSLSIIDLDEVIFYTIGKYLDIKDKTNLRLVCHKFSEEFLSPVHWKKLELFTISSLLDQKLLKTLCKRTGALLNHLNIKNCYKITDAELKGISLTCPNLQQLSLSNCWPITDRGIKYLAKNTKVRLRSFYLPPSLLLIWI